MPTQNVAQQLFQGLLNVLKAQLAALTPDEVQAAGPAIVTFFDWLAANPGAVLNPPQFLPQLAVLQASLLAAQNTVGTDLVKQGAQQMATLFQNLIAQTKPAA